MVSRPGQRPSPVFGGRLAARLWQLAAALTAAQLVAVVPALVILDASIGRAMAVLPADLADGEVLLVALEALAPARGQLAAAVAAAVVATWLLAVVARAAVVTWRTWGGETTPRLGTLLGLGLGRVVPFLRLGIAAATLHAVVLSSLWLPLGWAVRVAHQGMAEARMERLLWLGLALTPCLVLVVWAASLRAAWLLERPDRRSAVMALLSGLLATLVEPVRSLGTVVVWAVAGWAASLLLLAVGVALPLARHALATTVLGVVGGLVATSCSLALLASFAPTAGLVKPGDRR